MNAPAAKKKNERSQSSNTPEIQVAYCFLHEKRTKRADGTPLEKPRYDFVGKLPKLTADPSTCPNYKFLAGHCMEAAGKMWPGAGWPAGAIWPIQDGDTPHAVKPKPGVTPLTAEQIAQKNAWRTGHWVFEASHNLDPGPKVMVMQNGQGVEIPAKIINGVQQYKSGDYGIAHLHAYAYENKQFGVNFGFEGILFTRPGEAIGSSGAKSAEAMFGGVAPLGGAAPLPPGPPQPPAVASPPLAPAAPAAPPAPVYAGAPAAYAPPQPPAPPSPPGALSAPGLPPFPHAR